MTSPSLVRDVERLTSWLDALSRRSDAAAAGDRAAARFAETPPLTGPLNVLLPHLEQLRRRELSRPKRRPDQRALDALQEMVASLQRQCEKIQSTYELWRITPEEPNYSESPVSDKRRCRLEFEIATAEATEQVYALSYELTQRRAVDMVRIRRARKRSARLHLARIDAITAGSGRGGSDRARRDRALWQAIAESGDAVDAERFVATEDDIASEWVDKSADLVVLDAMIAERGSTDPRRWFTASAVKPRQDWEVRFRSLTELARTKSLFVVGSTHPGEDGLLLDAFAHATEGRADLALVLAPRSPEFLKLHHERGSDVVSLANRLGQVRRLSELSTGDTPRVVLVDCTGLLRAVYGVGSGAFVAGSLLAAAGHNVCEPMIWGIPTWTGGNHQANLAEWEHARKQLAPHLRVVETHELPAMMSEWVRSVDSGRVEREREVVRGTLLRYLGSLSAASAERVRAIPDETWRCAERFGPACTTCGGEAGRCPQWPAMERYHMCTPRGRRWFVRDLARVTLRAREEKRAGADRSTAEEPPSSGARSG